MSAKVIKAHLVSERCKETIDFFEISDLLPACPKCGSETLWVDCVVSRESSWNCSDAKACGWYSNALKRAEL